MLAFHLHVPLIIITVMLVSLVRQTMECCRFIMRAFLFEAFFSTFFCSHLILFYLNCTNSLFFSPDFVICDGILWLCFIFSDWTYPGIFHIFGNLKQNQYVVYLFYPGYIHQQFILSVARISFVIMLYIFPLDECTLYAPICFEPNHYMKV